MLLGKRLYALLTFILVSILGGVLVAGLMVPAVGVAASTTKDALTGVNDLPVELEAPPQWQRSKLLTANGKVLAYFYDQNRIYVSLDKISADMKMAQVGIEDHRFYEHGAMDLTGTLRALVSTTQGNTQGGSSLTQQYVRMVLVEKAEASGDKAAAAAAKEESIARKIRELRYAIAVEKEFTKDQILEFYLNMAYYGDGAYGVEAAARHYFGVTAANLNLAQSAMLAGLVRNPVATNPVSHTVVAISRRNDVLDRLQQLGEITAAQAAAAKTVTFDKSKVVDARTGCANSPYPFVCDYAFKALTLDATSLGATPQERKERVYRGGLTIQTQIDVKAQKAAEKTIRNYISGKDPVVSVITMMQPGTGLILAMAQNRQEMGKKSGQTYWNYAASNRMGGSNGFFGGSTFKIFTAAAALSAGMGAYGSIHADGSHDYKGETFKSCDGPFKFPSSWTVDGEAGTYNLWTGTQHSVNNYFVPLEQAVGICNVVKMAQTVGLKPANGEDLIKDQHSDWFPSFTLGAAGISPLSLTEAYATFAARGMHCDPVILKSITTSDGTSLAVPDANCKQVISKDLADTINQIFRGPYNGGTATLAKVPGVDMAGKTGTVSLNRAIWTMGYTPDLAAAAMISYDNDPKYKKFWKARRSFLRGVYLKHSGHSLTGFSGGEAGGRLLKPAFAAAIADIKNRHKFAKADQSILKGVQVGVPSCSGQSVSGCAKTLAKAGFSSTTSRVYSDLPVGALVGTSPSGSAGKGSMISILVSKGPDPKAKKKKKKNPPTVAPTPAPSPTR